MTSETLPANDASPIQQVRGALGKRSRGTPRINVSSCVTTLHGTVRSAEERSGIETTLRSVPGVGDVVNKLGVR